MSVTIHTHKNFFLNVKISKVTRNPSLENLKVKQGAWKHLSFWHYTKKHDQVS